MSCVNFAQSKQEKFNIPNPPEYPPELFNFSIKRFRRRISTPVVINKLEFTHFWGHYLNKCSRLHENRLKQKSTYIRKCFKMRAENGTQTLNIMY